MTRLNPASFDATSVTEWIQRNQEQVKTHSAWHPNISENDSEILLKDKSPFTYILRFEEKANTYFISFVKEDRSIKHQFFTLEFDRKGWYYLNGATDNSPTEIVSEDMNELIPLMMHCDVNSCIPYKST